MAFGVAEAISLALAIDAPEDSGDLDVGQVLVGDIGDRR